MGKRKNNRRDKKRDKRHLQRKEKAKQKRKVHGGGPGADSAGSLDSLKRAPAPEFLPGAVLLAGAMLPIIAVRWAPQWPAWAYVMTWVASLVLATAAARSIAQRRVPKWDPILFFGAGAVLATVLWSHDSGAFWLLNNTDEPVTWSVDGGLETQLKGRERARLDLRAGHHVALVGTKAFEIDLAGRQRALVSHGVDRCVLVGAQRFEGEQFVLGEAAPDPVLCPRPPSKPVLDEAGKGSGEPPTKVGTP